ncbi:MAG TPA: methionyl-tRNA formyltransferase [Solirubrobacteraceae bacterium]|nr:methionyl-tRNA formyltransferase [Solirubrobacteraceae bacterium]
MRTAFIGTSPFAVTVLEALAGSRHRPALVITRPPRPRGRGRHEAPTPVAEAAARLGLPLLAPERLNEAAEQLAAVAPQALCLCAYGALVREPILSDYEILNVHPSLLPRWRGAAPVERAIIAGDRETGVCIMRLVAELDAGPVCARATTAIDPGDDYGSLAGRLAAIAGPLLIGALDGPRVYAEQDGEPTYAAKIEPAERVLDPQRPAAELERLVRALHPHIGARLADGLRVERARVAGDGLEPGRFGARDGRLFLGALELLVVKPPGGREMAAADYLRGHARI